MAARCLVRVDERAFLGLNRLVRRRCRIKHRIIKRIILCCVLIRSFFVDSRHQLGVHFAILFDLQLRELQCLTQILLLLIPLLFLVLELGLV